MNWEGLSEEELCKRLKDPALNGQRAPKDLIEHMESEPLVLWGWSPGEGREPIPISHKSSWI
jgi:hypothetical protein